MYPINSLVQVFCKLSLSSLTIVYYYLVLNSYPLTLLVPISANFRPPSHHNVFCKLHSSPFLTKLILLEMYLVCFVFLPLFAIHSDDFISNIIRGACFGTTYGSLFITSFFRMMKCAKAITAVNPALYSLSELYFATVPGTCVK